MSGRLSLLQITPRAPDDCGGVGDYARQLASRLQESHGIHSTFISAVSGNSPGTVDGFEVLSPLRDLAKKLPSYEALLLHYVNYGYNSRGIPLWLPALLRQLKSDGGARLVTIFHELYAAGSWRQSAFWLRPLQKRIARSLAALSVTSIVSNDTQRTQLARLAPASHIVQQPVMSNFGEPSLSLSELASRDPHRWLICGGTELLERSLSSFLQNAPLIPISYYPRELLVIGGMDSRRIRTQLERMKDMKVGYHPRIESNLAATLISTCAFAWVDYFHEPWVPMSTIFKSTVFAAICAHGVIPVFPHAGSPIRLGDDKIPGPFFVTESGCHLPLKEERARLAESLHTWYRRNASSEHLARTVATAIGLAA